MSVTLPCTWVRVLDRLRINSVLNLTSKHYLEKNESGIHVSVDLDDENLNTRKARLENVTLMV